MSKRKKNYNIRHKKGSRFDNVIPDGKKNPRLRPVSTDAGAWIADNPLYLLAYTGAFLAGMYILKFIIQ